MPETNASNDSPPLHTGINLAPGVRFDDALDLNLRAAITLAPGFTLTIADELADDDNTKYLVSELFQMLDRGTLTESIRRSITMLIEQGDEGDALDEMLDVIGWIDNRNCSDTDESLARKANVLLTALPSLSLHDLVSMDRRGNSELHSRFAVNRRLEWERWTDAEKELHQKQDRAYWPRIPANWKVRDVAIVDGQVKIGKVRS